MTTRTDGNDIASPEQVQVQVRPTGQYQQTLSRDVHLPATGFPASRTSGTWSSRSEDRIHSYVYNARTYNSNELK